MLYSLFSTISRGFNKIVVAPLKKCELHQCGRAVHLSRGVRLIGVKNIEIGNSVSIGENCLFMTTRARILIGNHVMTGPNITMITGDHKVDLVGRYMNEIKDYEKDASLDQDIVIEGDNWIGANSTILKGVTVGYGSIIAAGSLVKDNVPPFAIVGGDTG